MRVFLSYDALPALSGRQGAAALTRVALINTGRPPHAAPDGVTTPSISTDHGGRRTEPLTELRIRLMYACAICLLA